MKLYEISIKRSRSIYSDSYKSIHMSSVTQDPFVSSFAEAGVNSDGPVIYITMCKILYHLHYRCDKDCCIEILGLADGFKYGSSRVR